MTSIGVYALKANLSSLGRRAAAGEEVCVTRHGKPWFKLVAIDADHEPAASEARWKRELAELDELLDAVPKVKNLTAEEIKSWINEGRDIT